MTEGTDEWLSGVRRRRRDVDLLTSDTALLETLILQAPVAFAFYGPDLRYRRINRMLADINGLPMADHIGRRPAELLGDLGVAVEERLRQVLRHRRGRQRRRLQRAVPGHR